MTITMNITMNRWVIDILALRVGGEKNDDEADTVGCCSLRVEHIKLKQEGQGELDIELEFLGKDSMQYKQTTDFSAYGDIGRLVQDCCKIVWSFLHYRTAQWIRLDDFKHASVLYAFEHQSRF